MVSRRDMIVGGAAVGTAATLGSDLPAQADTVFTSFAYPVGVSTAARTTGTRFSEILNVRDFGAVGDGLTDDRPAIQKCFDTAYGSSSAPFGGLSSVGSPQFATKAVYFPAGYYHLGGPLTLTSVVGGWIYGAGRGSVLIQNPSSNSVTLKTNGCSYTKFEKISIGNNSGAFSSGIGLDLDWDGGNSSIGASLQGNVFWQCSLDGGGICVRVGHSGNGGNSNQWIGCSCGNVCQVGWQFDGPQAVSNSLIGCQPQQCAIGVLCSSNGGSCDVINGMSVQQSTNYDIMLLSSQGSCAIVGLRSESHNFLYVGNAINVYVGGCNQLSGISTSDIAFNVASSLANVTVDNGGFWGCVTGNGSIALRGNAFSLANPFTSSVGAFSGQVKELIPCSYPNGNFFAGLPAPANAVGLRTFIADSSVAVSGSSQFGNIISVGGGSSVYAPIWSDGANYRIG